MWWGAHEGMGWWMLWGSVFWVLTIFLVGWLLASAMGGGRGYRGGEPGAPSASHRETPLEVAERRYASGELTREEFLRIKEDLGRG